MSKVKLYTTTAILFLLVKANLLLAENTPVSTEGTDASSSGTYTGFTETTYNDPDWVLVISDSILRVNLCVPDRWYEKVFNPCYEKNRYWKLSLGAKTGRAFPMSVLSPGGSYTIDSFYVPEGFGFQLYDITTGEPCSPYLGGAKYASLTHWRDITPAPDGFEPGTLFVSGYQGELANYSIIVCRYPLRLHKTYDRKIAENRDGK
jgi:hypothetical protein